MKSRRARLPPLRSLLPASAQYSLPGRDRQSSNNNAAAIALNGLKGTAMHKQRFALSRAYTLLEPGPVVLLTTAHRDACNVMPMSWYSLLDFEPPLLACVVSAANHSQSLLRASRQCVLNIPTAELARQVVGGGNCSGSAVDKFARFKLAHSAASQPGECTTAGCLLCQPGMPGGRHPDGPPLRTVRAGSGGRLGGHQQQGSADTAPPWLRQVHGRRAEHPAALEDALSTTPLPA